MPCIRVEIHKHVSTRQEYEREREVIILSIDNDIQLQIIWFVFPYGVSRHCKALTMLIGIVWIQMDNLPVPKAQVRMIAMPALH